MAVAVKTPSGQSTAPAKPIGSALVGLLGVVYVVAALALLFKVVPNLFWSGWESAVGTAYPFIGGSILLGVCAALAVFFVVLGGRLLGSHPTAGAKGSILIAFVLLLAALGLSRWVSLWVEYYAYNTSSPTPATGAVATAVAAAVFFVGAIYVLFRRQTQEFAVAVEETGLLSTTPYKGNQGHRVRRGTIFGILVLVGAGVYTLIHQGTLTRGAPDWAVNIPFTGTVAVDNFGDLKSDLAALPASAKTSVEVRYAGKTRLGVGDVVSFPAYVSVVENWVKNDEALKAAYDKAITDEVKADPVLFADVMGREIFAPAAKAEIAKAAFAGRPRQQLQAAFDSSSYEDQSGVLSAIKEAGRELGAEKSRSAVAGPALDLPIAVPVIDRYTIRDLNAKASPDTRVFIRVPGESSFTYGQKVSREDFDKEEEKVKAQPGAAPPIFSALDPASGRTAFASILLLPAVQFTVPLLLLGAALWVAWRIVNIPAFADFLIATEAELNKVSWTSQRRLVQDTIVVLVTLVLTSVFLFGTDYLWKVILSAPFPKVLYIPEGKGAENKKSEDKRW